MVIHHRSTELKELLGLLMIWILKTFAGHYHSYLMMWLISRVWSLKKAVEAYNDGTIADEDKDFIYAIRYPIAVAYRLHAIKWFGAHQ
jgi:hypothetical protein